jgi:hypothetical protein
MCIICCFVIFAIGSRSVIIALSRTSITKIIQRHADRHLIRYRVVLFRFEIFRSICIHVHNAFIQVRELTTRCEEPELSRPQDGADERNWRWTDETSIGTKDARQVIDA